MVGGCVRSRAAASRRSSSHLWAEFRSPARQRRRWPGALARRRVRTDFCRIKFDRRAGGWHCVTASCSRGVQWSSPRRSSEPWPARRAHEPRQSPDLAVARIPAESSWRPRDRRGDPSGPRSTRFRCDRLAQSWRNRRVSVLRSLSWGLDHLVSSPLSPSACRGRKERRGARHGVARRKHRCRFDSTAAVAKGPVASRGVALLVWPMRRVRRGVRSIRAW